VNVASDNYQLGGPPISFKNHNYFIRERLLLVGSLSRPAGARVALALGRVLGVCAGVVATRYQQVYIDHIYINKWTLEERIT
jgi:hypothetical protein